MTRRRLIPWLGGLAVALAAVESLASPAPMRARPAQAGTGPEAGRLIYLSGNAKVWANQKAFPAERGWPLLRGDTVYLDKSSFALVRLSNGRLVRLEEDLASTIRNLVVLDEPKTREPLGAQVENLLSPEELRQAGNEILGYKPRAASARPVEARVDPADRVTLGGDSQAGGVAGASANDPASILARKRKALDSRKHPARASWYTVRQAVVTSQTGELPALVQPGIADGSLARCLSLALAGVQRPLKTVELLLHVEGGQVTRATVGGGLARPACVQPLEGRPLPEVEGSRWAMIQVPLE